MIIPNYAERVEAGYRMANLTAFLALLRSSDRYPEANGDIALTTGELGLFNADQAEEELLGAVKARQSGNSTYRMRFNHPLGGLSHGLNPYTDWSMSVLGSPPTHTYLFLGLDFYSAADLAQQKGWQTYLQNPFDDPDLFWHRIWAWITNSTVENGRKFPSWKRHITAADAAAFIRADGGAFVFHNLIPYLRPAHIGSTAKDWPDRELSKPRVLAHIIEDLRSLKALCKKPLVAYCTSAVAIEVLRKAGFATDDIVCWNAHPSKVFHPSTLYSRGNYFRPIPTTSIVQGR